MNFWVTALAAHASDMSSWIFLGYPAAIFVFGFFNIWMGIGLVFFMFLNWQFVAIPLRKMTQNYESLTLSSFFESRFSDTNGLLRITTVLIAIFYYTIYISSGLIGLAILLESLFNLPYSIGLIVAVLLIIPYLLIGGYVTLAWTDLVQGVFLMVTILFVPIFAIYFVGGWSDAFTVFSQKPNLSHFIPENLDATALIKIVFMTCSMGLAYFGQPHIITKFMGIKNAKDLKNSKYVGLSWQVLAITGATLIGYAAYSLFEKGIANNETIFLQMVLQLFNPFLATFMLCAVLGATITCIDSQILVIASNFTEDIYKKILKKTASSKELLLVSRLSIIVISIISLLIAYSTKNSIYTLVNYAFNGLGSAFGPLVLFSLYSKKTTRTSALIGVFVGGIISGIWPLLNHLTPFTIAPIIPGFISGSLSIWISNRINFKQKAA